MKLSKNTLMVLRDVFGNPDNVGQLPHGVVLEVQGFAAAELTALETETAANNAAPTTGMAKP